MSLLIRPPGIEAYLSKDRPDIAGSFTRGFQLAEMQRGRKEDNKLRQQQQNDRMLAELGPDAIINPETGGIDVFASMNKRKEREDGDKFAFLAGEMESLGMPQDGVTDEARNNPAFRQGMAKGLMLLSEREHDKELRGIGRTGTAGAAGSGTKVSLRRGDDGDTTTYSFDEESFNEFNKREEDRQREEEQERPLKEALENLDEARKKALKAQNKGDKVEVEEDEYGHLTVTPRGFWGDVFNKTITPDQLLRDIQRREQKLTGATRSQRKTVEELMRDDQ